MPERATAAHAAVTAGKLALGASLEAVSLALAVVALLGCAFTEGAPLAALAGSLALAAGQLYWGLRVRFDRQIFAGWAAAWQHPGANPAADMAAFDATIGRAGPARGIDARSAGALGLLRWQAALLAAQGLALGVAAWLADW